MKPLITATLVAFTVLGISGCAQQQESSPATDSNRSMETEMIKGNELSELYVMKSESAEPLVPNKPVQLTFSVKEKESGIPIRNFERVHEKLAHLIVVSKDLSEFQHLHPDVVGAGKLSTKTTFPKGGEYLCFLQFSTPEQHEQTVKETLQVGSGKSTAPDLVPDADKPKLIDGYKFSIMSLPKAVNVATMPMVSIEKDGKQIANIEPYLGAAGHGVIISEDGQYFLHVHPMSEAATNGKFASPVMFHTVIPKPGLYKMWAQFQIDGKLEVADFTFEVH